MDSNTVKYIIRLVQIDNKFTSDNTFIETEDINIAIQPFLARSRGLHVLVIVSSENDIDLSELFNGMTEIDNERENQSIVRWNSTEKYYCIREVTNFISALNVIAECLEKLLKTNETKFKEELEELRNNLKAAKNNIDALTSNLRAGVCGDPSYVYNGVKVALDSIIPSSNLHPVATLYIVILIQKLTSDERRKQFREFVENKIAYPNCIEFVLLAESQLDAIEILNSMNQLEQFLANNQIDLTILTNEMNEGANKDIVIRISELKEHLAIDVKNNGLYQTIDQLNEKVHLFWPAVYRPNDNRTNVNHDQDSKGKNKDEPIPENTHYPSEHSSDHMTEKKDNIERDTSGVDTNAESMNLQFTNKNKYQRELDRE